MDFDSAVTKFRPLINKLARKFSFNRTQREDMEQILLTELWASLANHNQNLSQLNTYIHNRLKWMAINTIKKNNRDNDNNISLDPVKHANAASYRNNHDPDDMFDFLSSRLDDRSKQILSLSREGYNHAEIGQLLELTTQRVQQIMANIKDLGQELRKVI